MLLVSNIQRFCLHDGPGIRTTVFLKGCSLTCPWCCNPENLRFVSQFLFRSEKCLRTAGQRCDACAAALQSHELASPSDWAGARRSPGARSPCALAVGTCGEEYDEDDLVAALRQDAPYFRASGGGVTLSGGEPLSHPIGALLTKLAEEGIPVAIETSLLVDRPDLPDLIPSLSYAIVDAKIMDPARSVRVLGASSQIFMSNIASLAAAGIAILLRVPLVEGFTADDANLRDIGLLARRLGIRRIQLLPHHRLAHEKWLGLGLRQPQSSCPPGERVAAMSRAIEAFSGARVEVLSIQPRCSTAATSTGGLRTADAVVERPGVRRGLLRRFGVL